MHRRTLGANFTAPAKAKDPKVRFSVVASGEAFHLTKIVSRQFKHEQRANDKMAVAPAPDLLLLADRGP